MLKVGSLIHSLSLSLPTRDRSLVISLSPYLTQVGCKAFFSNDIAATLEYLTTVAVAVRSAGAKYRDIRAEQFASNDSGSETLRKETTMMIDSIRISGLYKRGQTVSLDIPVDEKVPEYLCSRLTECNVKRRSRIEYASRHSKLMKKNLPIVARSMSSTTHDKIPDASDRMDKPGVAPNMAASPPQVADWEKATTIKTSQASTAPTPVNREDFTTNYPVDQHGERGTIVNTTGSFVASKLTMKYPRQPKIGKGLSHFECSCCHLLLSRDHHEANMWKYVSSYYTACVWIVLILYDLESTSSQILNPMSA